MTSQQTDNSFITDIKHLASLIKDNWSLMGFLGNREKEVMVAQTINAARNNFNTYGEPFSIRGNNVFTSSGGGLIDNAGAYADLLQGDLFREEERDLPERGHVTVIFPTEKLVEKLKEYFASKGKR